MPWQPLVTSNGDLCALSNVSIKWVNDLGSYHATGDILLEYIPVHGAFRVYLDGCLVVWKHDGSKEKGPAIKHCIYLPVGGKWQIDETRRKSSRRPEFKVFAVRVDCSCNRKPDEVNKDGLRNMQVSVEAVNGSTSDAERFTQALHYANTESFAAV